jgi:4-amino-4-deoxy-L-arabinose transferase-like glycosyltransferase
MKFLVHLILFACLGAAGYLLYTSMRFGPGVSPDSVVYLQTAESLLAGRGFTAYGEPMTHFPPFYSIVLAFAGLLPVRLMAVARLIQPAIFVLNAALFMFAVWTASRRSIWPAVAGGGFFLTSAQMLHVHSFVWSEGLFYLLLLSGYLLLAYYLASQRRTLLILAAILTGLAILTRYAGFALLPPMVLMLMIAPSRPLRRKIQDAALLMTVALTPIAAWMIRNLLVDQAAANRELAVHLFEQRHLNRFYQSVTTFFWPSNLPDIPSTSFALVFFGGLIVIAVLYLRKNLQYDTPPSRAFYLVSLHLSFAVVYLVFLIVSISFVDAAIPMDFRLLLPFFGAIVISLIAMVSDLVSGSKLRYRIWAPLALATVIFLGYQVQDAARHHQRLSHEGLGYQNTDWIASRTVDYLQSIPHDNLIIYSNGRGGIAHRVGFDTFLLPRKFSATSLRPNEQYQNDMDEMCAAVRSGAMIVYFQRISRDFNPTAAEIEAHCKLPPALVFNDGYIYRVD